MASLLSLLRDDAASELLLLLMTSVDAGDDATDDATDGGVRDAFELLPLLLLGTSVTRWYLHRGVFRGEKMERDPF